MTATRTSTTPSLIDWAIKESGFSVEQVAKSVGVPLSAVQSWTKGEFTPTRPQLARLAKKLDRPSTLFYLKAPPTDVGPIAELRTAHGRGSRELLPNERLTVRRAARRQAFISSLREQDGAVALPEIARNQPPEEAGAILRDWSGVSPSDQFRWRNNREAFKVWVQAFERNRLVVMQLSLGREGLRGFSLPDEFGPAVAVNTAEPPPARTFTLWHELAHLALGGMNSCLGDIADTEGLERWCDRTASAVLMPRNCLEDVAASLDCSSTDSVAMAKKTASKFRVSARAAAVALIHAKLLPQIAYREIDLAMPVDVSQPGGGSGGRRRFETRIAEIGISAARTISEAVENQTILEIEARRALDLDGVELEWMKEAVT